MGDRKLKGEAGAWETQQGQRANGVGVTRCQSHCEVLSRGHAGAGGEWQKRKRCQRGPSYLDAWTAVVTKLEDTGLGRGGGHKSATEH